MGIKFYCPNGHKVNVKSFLAGKKGLCPKCGVRVTIPLESQIDDGPSSRSGSQVGSATEEEAELITDNPADYASSPAGPSTLSLVEDEPVFTGMPTPSGFGDSATHLSHSVTNAENAGPFVDNAFGDDDQFLPPTSHSAPQQPRGVAWHVQFTTGQQLGPLDESTLEQWLSDGRITTSDLVWREGWPNWQAAGSVFSQLQGNQSIGQATPVAGRIDDPLQEALQQSLPASSGNFYQRHRGRREIRARLSLVLLGIVIFLFAFLLYIFVLRESAPESKDSKQPGVSASPATMEILPI